ncbi:hypothetical protein C943_03858 [Mariniradius saccharolyticus AK6]|uniref:Uncharacterized protein n=1 Tax=Mariniradius saccharolyticus AK6 TaxID=1239962 RepID=M7XZV7_9BACT|nr:hypothetical protein C943_03858 [Mariniradius saccharolyticus AK6]
MKDFSILLLIGVLNDPFFSGIVLFIAIARTLFPFFQSMMDKSVRRMELDQQIEIEKLRTSANGTSKSPAGKTKKPPPKRS